MKLSRFQEKTLALALGFLGGFFSKPVTVAKKPKTPSRHFDGQHTRHTRDSRPPHIRYSKEIL